MSTLFKLFGIIRSLHFLVYELSNYGIVRVIVTLGFTLRLRNAMLGP